MASDDESGRKPEPSKVTLRRASVTSITSGHVITREALSKTLDEIHSNASRSEGLTAFNDFAPPPASSQSSRDDGKSFTEQLVRSGFGSIYSRLKSTVSVPIHNQPSPYIPAEQSSTISESPNVQRVASKNDRHSNSRPNSTATSQVSLNTKQLTSHSEIPIPGPTPTSEKVEASLEAIDRTQNQHSVDTTPSPRSAQRSTKRHSNGSGVSETSSQSEKKLPSAASTSSVVQSGALRNMDPDLVGAARHKAIATQSPTTERLTSASSHAYEALSSGRKASPALQSPISSSFTNHTVSNNNTSPSPRSTFRQDHTLPQDQPHFLPIKAEGKPAKSDGIQLQQVSRVMGPPPPPLPLTKSSNRNASKRIVEQMKAKVLSRDFWMKDENAKVCFQCGDGFSTFRRKHHCRLCGQIYCSTCTKLISGKAFGQASKLRICKTCEGMLYGDDSSDYTEDDELATSQVKQIRFSELPGSQEHSDRHAPLQSKSSVDKLSSGTRSDSSLRLTLDGRSWSQSNIHGDHSPALARPGSSRSLKSLTGRSHLSNQKYRRVRHQHMRSLSALATDSVPFQQHEHPHHGRGQFARPVFHEDAIIDPDLAPFMSDDNYSDDEIPSIASLSTSNPRHSTESVIDVTQPSSKKSRHDSDNQSMSSTRPAFNKRSSRVRALSTGSVGRHGPSPRIIRSDNLFKNAEGLLAITANNAPVKASSDDEDVSLTRQPQQADADLNQASLVYLKALLQQFLKDAKIAHHRRWEKALVPILLRCAGLIDPNIQRGDDIDIRHYVKMKKIPGSSPGDSSYVSGIVFTKNIALKDMKRSIRDARILLIAFPIEYARQESHFMSLEPVIAQEREYLRNIVRRIAALRPHVLFVHRHVSGLALQFLQETNISVIHNVKDTVMEAVARCTKTRIITSVDRLTMDPNSLGRCGSFDVRTSLHQGHKKTCIFLSGCQPDLGCTIVLRGSDSKTLSKMKRIVEFLCYVTYNLRLETSLMRDQFLAIPQISEKLQIAAHLEDLGVCSVPPGLSACTEGKAAQAAIDKGSTNSKEQQLSDKTHASMYRDLKKRLLSVSPWVALAEPFLISKGREQEERMESIRRLQQEQEEQITFESLSSEKHLASPSKFELIKPEMIYGNIKSTSPQAREILSAIYRAEFDKALHTYEALRRRWDAYIAGVVDPFSPITHQRIILLFSIVSTATMDACEGPDLVGIDFYREHDFDEGLEPDIPLGEYIERLCNQADSPCVAYACERRMIDHHREYVHGDGQIKVYIEKYPSRFKGMENTILMWSKCRICEQETQITPMSSDSWKYSFGKYLELTYWNQPIHPRAGDCTHDVYKDHVKYFGLKNLAVRFEHESITILEVRVPRNIITWKVERDLRLKNDQFRKIEELMRRFIASVKQRILSINVGSIESGLIGACKAEVGELMSRAEEEELVLVSKLREKYMMSKFYEIIPLNRAVRFMQDKVAGWDLAFAEFEKNFFPSERDIRKLAAIQLKKVFLDDEDPHTAAQRMEEKMPQITVESDLKTHVSVEKEQIGNQTHSHNTRASTNATALSELAVPDANSPILIPTESLHRRDKQLVENLDLAITPASPNMILRDLNNPVSSAPHSVDPLSSSVREADVHSSSKDADFNDDQGHNKSGSPQRDSTFGLSPTSPIENTKVKDRSNAPPLLRMQTQPTVLAQSPLNHMLETLSSPEDAKAKIRSSQIPISSTSKLGIGTADKSRKLFDAAEDSPTKLTRSAIPSMLPRAVPLKKPLPKVSELAKHFEQMSREFEKERLRERRLRAARTRLSKVFPIAASQPVVEVFRNASDAVQEQDPSGESDSHGLESQGSVKIDQAENSEISAITEVVPEQEISFNTGDGTSQDKSAEMPLDSSFLSYPPSDNDDTLSGGEEPLKIFDELTEDYDDTTGETSTISSVEMPKHEKTSLMKLLTSFWSERSASGWLPLEYPLGPSDHIFADSDVIVREDEPSSLIAFSLASADYAKKAWAFYERLLPPSAAETGTKFKSHQWPDDSSLERILLGSTATHLRYQFQNGPARMQCKIFYGEAFDALRRKCSVSDRFVESLSRCVKWDSKGGKTKSVFLKTMDERLVMKSLAAVEVQAFLRFAPDYFDYMSKCLFHGLPTALAKIFGIYQVVIKNNTTGTDLNYFFQVMENVFYEGPSDRMFDLKGSMRNRRIQSTGEKDEVLLDENLLDYISQSPVYVRHHSNTLLASSIANDTLFCSKQNVMDYSLIVGLYDDRKELVVGIIDYIRTYTWDKKLESWIKDRGKNKPTVRSPKDYRNRFRASIPRYFPLAPSCWQVFGIQRILDRPILGFAGEDDPANESPVEAENESEDKA